MKKTLLALLALAAVLGAVELLLDAGLFARRLVSGPGGAPASEARWESDDYLRGRILPGQRGVTVGPSRANFNSLGLRGAEPRRSAHRILCLGDSVTFGWGASVDAAAYPAVLEEILAARGLAGVEVVNAGMPRWNSADLLDLYVTRLTPLRPQTVVLMLGWNDIGYEFAPAPSAGQAGGRLGEALRSSFSTARVVAAVLDRLDARQDPEAVLAARVSAADDIRWDRLDEYERIVAALVALVRQQGSRPVLVALPHFLHAPLSEDEKRILLPHLLAWPNLSYDGWRRVVAGINERIRRVATAAAVPLADCERAVPTSTFIDLCHYDDAGHRALAECVAATVEPLAAEALAR